MSVPILGADSWREYRGKPARSLGAADFQRFQVDMASAANGHAQALQDAQADLQEIIGKLIPAHAAAATQAIVQTLDQRAQSGWLANSLGVIA